MIQDVKSAKFPGGNSDSESPEGEPSERLFTLNTVAQTMLILGMLTMLMKGLSFWGAGLNIIPGTSVFTLLITLILPIGLLLYLLKKRSIVASPLASGLVLLVLFFSQWLELQYGLLQTPVIRGEIFLFSLIASIWIMQRKSPPFPVILPLACFALFYTLTRTAGDSILFSDDNPTFLYRLTLLKENFPNIPFYNPLWNAGTDQRYVFATGSLNFFFLFAPFVYLFSPEHIYNHLVFTLLFILTPALAAWACALAGMPRRAGLIAAVLALTPSLLWYRWALQYGTLGFVTSCALIPLNVVLVARAVGKESGLTPALSVLLVVSITLMLFWSPSGLVFLPAIFYTLVSFRRLLKKKYLFLIALFLICLNLPWIGLFWKVSKVNTFLKSEKSTTQVENLPEHKVENAKDFKEKSGQFSLEMTVSKIREITTSMNPLILLFFLPGIFLLKRDIRVTVVLTSLWLLFLGGGISPYKPQLELDRMLIILTMILILPSAAALHQLFLTSEDSTETRGRHLYFLTAALSTGFLIAGVYAAASVMRNRSLVPIAFSTPLVPSLTEAISKQKESGRVLFSGFMLHDFGGGHIAPLAYFTGKPLMASSPVHNLWSYQQIFPDAFLERGDAGIQEYLNLYNVSYVVAHEKLWRDYFNDRPEQFEKIWSYANFNMYRRLNNSGSYFLNGQGTVELQDSHSVQLSLASDEAVIAFNYFRFLTSESCTLSPYPVTDGITFTKLSDCKTKEKITIHSVNPVKRYMLPS